MIQILLAASLLKPIAIHTSLTSADLLSTSYALQDNRNREGNNFLIENRLGKSVGLVAIKIGIDYGLQKLSERDDAPKIVRQSPRIFRIGCGLVTGYAVVHNIRKRK